MADRAGLAARLAEHGVAFFPNAFSKEECDLLIQQFVSNCDVNEVFFPNAVLQAFCAREYQEGPRGIDQNVEGSTSTFLIDLGN